MLDHWRMSCIPAVLKSCYSLPNTPHLWGRNFQTTRWAALSAAVEVSRIRSVCFEYLKEVVYVWTRVHGGCLAGAWVVAYHLHGRLTPRRHPSGVLAACVLPQVWAGVTAHWASWFNPIGDSTLSIRSGGIEGRRKLSIVQHLLHLRCKGLCVAASLWTLRWALRLPLGFAGSFWF